MYRLLNFERGFSLKPGHINKLRGELMAYMKSNNNRLSMMCNGNCYDHQALTVICCHQQISKGKENDSSKTTRTPTNNSSSGPEGTDGA